MNILNYRRQPPMFPCQEFTIIGVRMKAFSILKNERIRKAKSLIRYLILLDLGVT